MRRIVPSRARPVVPMPEGYRAVTEALGGKSVVGTYRHFAGGSWLVAVGRAPALLGTTCALGVGVAIW